MPEETGRVIAVQAEVQYQPAEIAGQWVRVSANPEEPDRLEGPEGREGPERLGGRTRAEELEGPVGFAVLPWYTSPPRTNRSRTERAGCWS